MPVDLDQFGAVIRIANEGNAGAREALARDLAPTALAELRESRAALAAANARIGVLEGAKPIVDASAFDGREPIHDWFGLTYSSYLVLPRTLMQAMPVEWQDRAVKMFDEIRDATANVPQAARYIVKAAYEREIAEMSEGEHLLAGTSEDDECVGDDGDGGPEDTKVTYFDEDGRDVDADHRVLIPADDPVPHYRSSEGRSLRLAAAPIPSEPAEGGAK